MSKGTIIYVGGFELPDKNAAAHRVLNNAKLFREMGYNIVFIGIDKNIDYVTSTFNTTRNVQGFTSFSVPYPHNAKQWYNYLSNVDGVINIMSKYEDLKAIVCYNYQSIAFLKLQRIAKQRSIKLIADCTEWYGPQGRTAFMKFLKGIDSFLRMRIIHKKVDGLIVISKHLKEYYKNLVNLVELPPLIDIKEKKWEEELNQNEDKSHIKLTYSGSPGFKKDKINFIINGLYELGKELKFHFNIIGIEEKEYLSYYPQDANKLEVLNGKVNFLGKVTHVQSIEILKKSDFSIFIRENNIVNRAGFPTKLVESITAGIPVITNRTSNIDEYICNGENGYLIDDDIKKGLEGILNYDSEKLRQMKRNIDKEIFYYAEYLEKFKTFLEKINL